MSSEQELLAVSDMSEESQIMWSLVHTDMREPESLADLAFRLRDEVVVNYGDLIWHKATLKICGYMGKNSIWFKQYAKPIHWIIAALIAKTGVESNDK